MKMYTSKTRGFTLIELLVVVLIIGILAAVALPQYQMAILKTRAVQAWILLDSIFKAENIYRLTHGEYPTLWEDLDIDLPNGTISGNHFYADWGSCTLMSNATSCKVKGAEGLEFFQSHGQYGGKKLHTCRAYCDNPLAIKVCESYGWKDVSSPCAPGTPGTYRQWQNQL